MVEVIMDAFQTVLDSWYGNFTLFNDSLFDSPYEENEEEGALMTLVPMTVVYSVLFATGVVGNVCTCVVIARNRYMHTATNYYLFSLAVSDLLLLSANLPHEIYLMWVPRPYPLGEVMCVTRGFTAETSTNASILTITSFTAERYVAICHPLRSHRWSRPSRAVRVVAAVWAVAALSAVPVSFQFGLLLLRTGAGEDIPGMTYCALKNPLPHAFLASSLLFFFVPQVLIFALYFKIGLRLRLPVPEKADSTTTRAGGESNSVKREKEKRRISINSNRKGIVKMLVAVVLSFFFCFLPFHTQRLMADYVHNPPSPLFNAVYPVICHISGVSFYLSPTINPILYQVMSLKFQQAFKDTFGPFSRCLSGEAQAAELAQLTTECTQASTRVRRPSPFGSPQTTAFNI